MFSFHKPKVYRSSTGCCICKAKSSSSRFTDSKKYEEDFIECFQLSSRRQGEICNACVLLVKRWKKLPDGPKRNWRHVVDARAGPGMKSMTKFKSKQKKQLMLMEHLGENKGRHHDGNNRRDGDDFEREFSPTLSDKSDDMDIVDYTNTMAGDDGPPNGNNTNSGGNEMDGIHGGSGESSPRLSHSPTGSECEDNGIIGNTVGVLVGSRRRKASKVVLSRRRRRQEERSETSVSAATRVSVGFIDLDYWTKESICCGVVFRGKNGEVLVDVGRGCRLKPCNISLQQQKVRPHSVAASIASAADQRTVLQSSVVVQSSNSNGDNSSDSGYDDATVGVGNAVDGPAMDSGALRASNETMHQTVLQLASVRRKPANVNGIAGRAAVSAGRNCDD